MRPAKESQGYPYAKATLLYSDGTHVMRGDQCEKNAPHGQREHEIKTKFVVDFGADSKHTERGEFIMDGELSFGDFDKWRKGELALTGHSNGPNGGEDFILVHEVCHMLL
jgi:hypothetical protein